MYYGVNIIRHIIQTLSPERDVKRSKMQQCTLNLHVIKIIVIVILSTYGSVEHALHNRHSASLLF